MIFLSLDLVVIIGILKMISTHSIMDSTAVSGAAGSGSIPDGCTTVITVYYLILTNPLFAMCAFHVQFI